MIGKNSGKRKQLVMYVERKIHNIFCYGGQGIRKRESSVKLQQPYIQEEEEIVGRLLFENTEIQETKRVIDSFWKIREKKIREKETAK